MAEDRIKRITTQQTFFFFLFLLNNSAIHNQLKAGNMMEIMTEAFGISLNYCLPHKVRNYGLHVAISTHWVTNCSF